jgi:hypothetical protein
MLEEEEQAEHIVHQVMEMLLHIMVVLEVVLEEVKIQQLQVVQEI